MESFSLAGEGSNIARSFTTVQPKRGAETHEDFENLGRRGRDDGADRRSASRASLGDGTVKDTNTNLIWLQNWDVNGDADWSTQKAWAEGLDFAGSTKWKLPEISDYAALFSAYGDLTQRGEFTNVQYGDYWSGTEYAPLPGYSWRTCVFSGCGVVLGGPQSVMLSAVAVLPGDVTASVPEPQTLALALLALGAAGVAGRRRSR